MPVDLSKVRVIIVGPQGSGKTWVQNELKKKFPDLLTNTIQSSTVDGESIVIRCGSDNQVETFYLNPTGPLGD